MAKEGKLTRRAFLQGTAALGAMAALSGCAGQETLEPSSAGVPAVEAGEAEVRHAWCQMCGPARTHCSTLCYIKDGRWTNVEGNPEAGNNWGRGSRSLCAKGNAAMAVLYAPGRLLYPMKRVGEKGEGKFERCTWDQAIEEIAAKLKEQKEKYGPESLGILSPQAWAVIQTLGRRFLNVHGSPNYMHSAICAMQRAASKVISIGKPSDTYPGQLDKTELLVIWGANPENSEINRGKPAEIVDAMQAGMKVIDIRPMREGLGSKADIWVPVRPGTDLALALAVLNVICKEGLYDYDFTTNWCNGFDKLAEHVAQFTPEWASPITGVPEEQIYEIARMMGTAKPMGILYGNGIGDQANDGNWACICICLIEAITGNLDIPGGGGAGMTLPPSLIKTNAIEMLTERLEATPEDEEKGYFPGMSKLVANEFPRWYQNKDTFGGGPGPTSAYFKAFMSILTEEPYPLRCVIGQNSNPLSATRQPKKIIEALKKLEYYVVVDTAWNPSCDYADIVLPALTNYETSQQFNVNNRVDGTWIGMNQVIVDPIGEGKSDWDFYMDLAVAMGYGDDFWGGDMDECLRWQLEPSGISLEELREKGQVFVERTDGAEATEPQYRNYEKLFAKLPGGKVQCYNEYMGGKLNNLETDTLPYLPEYQGPPEGLAETPELAEEYPLVFSDVHAYRLCNHSCYVDVPYLRELQPYPWVKINPETAQKYGIADGDWMKVESPHGWVKMVARYFEAISPEVLMARRGWWLPCDDLGLPGYGCEDGGSEVNVLYDTTIENFDPFHSAMSKQTLVKISKLEEDGDE